jgi:uroporphyrinogen decarboxylase
VGGGAIDMTRYERLVRLINREDVDYLPSQITFAERTRNEDIARRLGLGSADELDGYLENHIQLPFSLYDMPLFLRNDLELMGRLTEEGYAGLDLEGKTVYDLWGMGIRIGEEGFYYNYSPFKGDREANDRARPFLPGSFNKDLLDMSPLEAARSFVPPDPTISANLTPVIEEIQRYRREGVYAAPSGYFGIWERCNGMFGFPENTLYMAAEPEITLAMFERITDYKIRLAHELLKLDLPLYHHGDDLGFQTSTFFSEGMFRELLLPFLKRLFKVYKDAGKKIAYHSCGNITTMIPALIDAGVDVLEPVQPCMDLAYLKEAFGDVLVFWGGIDTQGILPHGTPDQVREHTRHVIRTLGRGGGLIIGPSQEIMSDIPVDNIAAMVETIREERTRALDG